MTRVRAERDRFVGFVNEDIDAHIAPGRLISERAKILDANTVQAGDRTIQAGAIVVAIGSSLWTPPPFRGLSSAVMIDNEGLFNLEDLAASVLVVGAGGHRLGARTGAASVGRAGDHCWCWRPYRSVPRPSGAR